MSVDSSGMWMTEMVADGVMLGYQRKEEAERPREGKAKGGDRFVKGQFP